MSWLLVVMACASSKAVEEGSCNAAELRSLLEVCLSYDGDFQGETDASGLEDCDIAIDVLLQNGGGACRIQGEGSCEVACDIPASAEAS